MAYDLHVVRTKNWLEASTSPVTKDQVDTLIRTDKELAWSTTDSVDMKDDSGQIIRYYAILWRGNPCFLWYKDQIQCSSPNEAQQYKLVEMALALGAYAVGDDGERYEIRKSLFGKSKVVVVQSDA